MQPGTASDCTMHRAGVEPAMFTRKGADLQSAAKPPSSPSVHI